MIFFIAKTTLELSLKFEYFSVKLPYFNET